MADSVKLTMLRMKLNETDCPFGFTTDEDLTRVLYNRDDLFVNFIAWVISKVDNELAEYLRKCEKPKRELINLLYYLQITKEEEKNKFVLGGLSEEQQLRVWFRLFDTVEDVSTYEEAPYEGAESIEDVVLKDEKNNLLPFRRCPSDKDKMLRLEELDLLLQDANAKLEQLEATIGDQPTTEVIHHKPTNTEDLDKTVTLVNEQLGIFRKSLAAYKGKPNFGQSKPRQSSDESAATLVAKVKQLGDIISSRNSFLSYLNGRKDVGKSNDEDCLSFKQICDKYSELCDQCEVLQSEMSEMNK